MTTEDIASLNECAVGDVMTLSDKSRIKKRFWETDADICPRCALTKCCHGGVDCDADNGDHYFFVEVPNDQ